jgi:LysM repeat protein
MNRIDAIITHSGPFSFLGMASCTVLDALCRRYSKKSKTGEDKVISAKVIPLKWEAVGERLHSAWSKTCSVWSNVRHEWLRWPRDKFTNGIILVALILVVAVYLPYGAGVRFMNKLMGGTPRTAHITRTLPVPSASVVKSVPAPQTKPVTPTQPTLTFTVPPPTFPVHYIVQRGDMASALAKKYYHDGNAWWPIAQANHLAGPSYWIYAGTTITIPSQESGRPNRTQGNAKQTSSLEGNSEKAVPVYLDTVARTPTIRVKVFESTVLANPPEIVAEENPIVEMPVATVDVTIAAPEPVMRVSPTVFYPKKVSGYELIIPDSKSAGIPLMKELETCVVFFDSEQALKNMQPSPTRDQDCKFKTWAERTRDGDVSFKVSLKQLPSEPFVLLVGGIANPIDGEWFARNATPFGDRFPGTRKVTEVAFLVGPILARGAMTTLMSGNPYLGIGAALAPPAIQGAKALLHHLRKQKQVIHSKETIR